MTNVFLLLELWIIEKFMVRRANRLLESLNALVKKPDFNQSFAYLLNGRCVRKAKAEDGKVYLVEYNHKTDQEFKAKLYQIPSGWLFKGQFNTKYFFAMRAVTIVGGIIVPVAMAFVAAAFRGPNSRQGLLGSMREDFLSLPSVILRTLNEEPHLLFFAGFPLFAIVTAFTSFFFKRA